jgi:hypothetical protein
MKTSLFTSKQLVPELLSNKHFEGLMKDRQHWRELCEQAAFEQDPDKLLELVREINRQSQPSSHSAGAFSSPKTTAWQMSSSVRPSCSRNSSICEFSWL